MFGIKRQTRLTWSFGSGNRQVWVSFEKHAYRGLVGRETTRVGQRRVGIVWCGRLSVIGVGGRSRMFDAPRVNWYRVAVFGMLAVFWALVAAGVAAWVVRYV